MFVTGSGLFTQIGGTGVNAMKIFTGNGDELNNTTSHKLLRVSFDQDLSFSGHVEQPCKKLKKPIGLLLDVRIPFYNTTVKPVLLYGGAIWS